MWQLRYLAEVAVVGVGRSAGEEGRVDSNERVFFSPKNSRPLPDLPSSLTEKFHEKVHLPRNTVPTPPPPESKQ